MLEIENITVSAENNIILKDISLKIKKGEILILFGPNGSGKSTLIKTIMGISGYSILKGKILFENEDISSYPVSKRARMGIGIMFQHPPKIHGVKLSHLVEYLSPDKNYVDELSERLKIKEFLQRELNVDLSGGEIKRVELFQILLQKPKLLLLDEPESGVDIENISIIGKVLNDYFKIFHCGALIITHTGYILEYVKANKGYVMMDGKIFCGGDPEKIFNVIKENGYEKCRKCEARVSE
ncbi:MAG TPA: ATP-binding cassette domain-containing protein [bacterium]|nr:ATP-binding cassette domain-containing protein [bacterium]